MLTIDLLKSQGYKAYLVGGCVRDLLLGRAPKDYDVATNAWPEHVITAMRDSNLRVIETGLQHGTVTVVDPEFGNVEVTTFRKDGEYTDGRRPDSVEYADTIEEDLLRRD